MKKSLLGLLVIGCAMLAAPAFADPITVVEVGAQDNSSSGGTGLDTGVTVTAGDELWITAEGCWSAGAAPRTSDADGLIPGTNPCSGDEGPSNFGMWTQGGLSAHFGSLVGRIGDGSFFVIGTSFNEIVGDSGLLKLFYWDSNNGDNTGSVLASIAIHRSVPEPGTLGLLGLGMLAMAARRRRDVDQ